MMKLRPTQAIVRASGLIALIIVAACGVGDQICPEGSNPNDRDDSCPFGPPGGPRPAKNPGEKCPDPISTGVCATWDDVFTIFTNTNLAQGGGNCSGAPCHAVGAFAPIMPKEDPALFYKNMTEYETELGRYLQPDPGGNPAKGWILCNLAAKPGGGSPMPKGPGGFRDVNSLDTIANWVGCGAPGPGAIVGTGGGGGGGGLGGAGGVGGN